jgi:hypothetical protein
MSADIAEFIIAVHIGIPGEEPAKVLRPDNNWIGSLLLLRLLDVALQRDENQTLQPPGASGFLNDCILTFSAIDREEAVKTIMAELEWLKLLPSCQIGVLDGGCLRCVHPSPEVKMEWLLDTERHEFFIKQRDEALDKLLGGENGRQGNGQ